MDYSPAYRVDVESRKKLEVSLRAPEKEILAVLRYFVAHVHTPIEMEAEKNRVLSFMDDLVNSDRLIENDYITFTDVLNADIKGDTGSTAIHYTRRRQHPDAAFRHPMISVDIEYKETKTPPTTTTTYSHGTTFECEPLVVKLLSQASSEEEEKVSMLLR